MKRILVIASILLSLMCFKSIGQIITFEKTFNAQFQDVAYDIVQTTDTGYIIVGSTRFLGTANGGRNVYLIKTNKYGDTLWTKNYGNNNWTFGMSVQQTYDGGYVIAGGDIDGDFGMYIIKTDSQGDSIWTKHYGNGLQPSVGRSIQQTTDGGYIITGYTPDSLSFKSYLYLVRLNSNGDSLWTRKISSGLEQTSGNTIQITPDGGYFITGTTRNSIGSYFGDILLLKTDSFGIPVWQKTYPDCEGSSGIFIDTNGYIAIGNDQNGKLNIYRTNNIGDTIWTKKYNDFFGNSIIQTNDKGLAITGKKYQNIPNLPSSFGDLLILKMDSSGNIQFVKTYGDSLNDGGISIKQTIDNGFAIAGFYDYGSGGAVIINGNDMGYYIKTDTLGNLTGIFKSFDIKENNMKVFPNPVSDYLNINVGGKKNNQISKITIFDIQGKQILQKQINTSQTKLDVSRIANGIYILEAITNSGLLFREKFIKQ